MNRTELNKLSKSQLIELMLSKNEIPPPPPLPLLQLSVMLLNGVRNRWRIGVIG